MVLPPAWEPDDERQVEPETTSDLFQMGLFLAGALAVLLVLAGLIALARRANAR